MICLNPRQQELKNNLDDIAKKTVLANKKSLFSFLKKPALRQGIYVYGPPGRGKSMIVRQFFEDLPIKNKVYFHFNQFMQSFHKISHDLRGKIKNQDLAEESAKKIISLDGLFCVLHPKHKNKNTKNCMFLIDEIYYLFT